MNYKCDVCGDTVPDSLKTFIDHTEGHIVDIIKTKQFTLSDLGKKLSKVSIDSTKVVDRLTPQLIRSGAWKNKDFRGYDVGINVPKVNGGKRHFVNQAAEYIRKIWLEMGFSEMIGPMVHTSFWDLDALFVPQDHPARHMQDTFYLKDPKKGKLPALHKKIKEVHD